MNKVRLNEDGDPIFYLLEIDFPFSYPAQLTGELKLKFLYLVKQFFQLQNLWEVQLRDHRNYWNIQAAYEFWCEHGTKTVHGRQFGWSERWLLDALNEVREEIHKLEETADQIKNAKAKAAKRNRRLLRGMPIGRDKGKDGRKMQQRGDSSNSETEPEPESPTHKPPRRPPGLQGNKRLIVPGLGTRERPIMIVQESDGEHPNQMDVTWRDRVHQENVDPRVLSSPDVRVHNKASKSPEHVGHQHKSGGSGKNPSPTTPVTECANSNGSTSTSPSKKRSRNRDSGLEGRPRKSPKHHSNSHAGSESSGCEGGCEGGCSLSLIDEED
ncbi:hypothetical protein VTN00DRAFT_4133 [Thermoascus crustaceus]|uniref:uncharacterized protein n=1 Tax=Thermoascus crustaceus TaxID=5088 RepID=UPI00374432BD